MRIGIADAVLITANRKGLKKKSIAEGLNVDYKTFSGWMEDPTSIRVRDLFRLARLLGWSRETLTSALLDSMDESKGDHNARA